MMIHEPVPLVTRPVDGLGPHSPKLKFSMYAVTWIRTGTEGFVTFNRNEMISLLLLNLMSLTVNETGSCAR
jgi:hypothetical protein